MAHLFRIDVILTPTGGFFLALGLDPPPAWRLPHKDSKGSGPENTNQHNQAKMQTHAEVHLFPKIISTLQVVLAL